MIFTKILAMLYGNHKNRVIRQNEGVLNVKLVNNSASID
jgi:hypothetical protein